MFELSYTQSSNLGSAATHKTRYPWPSRPIISTPRFLNPDGLAIGKLPNPVRPKFSAMARRLHTAKRQSSIGRDHSVDENHPCFNFVNQAFTFVLVIGPGTRSQTK